MTSTVKMPNWTYPRGYIGLVKHDCCTADQTTAYADARVAEAREKAAQIAESLTLPARRTQAWGNAEQIKPCEIAAAIRKDAQTDTASRNPKG